MMEAPRPFPGLPNVNLVIELNGCNHKKAPEIAGDGLVAVFLIVKLLK